MACWIIEEGTGEGARRNVHESSGLVAPGGRGRLTHSPLMTSGHLCKLSTRLSSVLVAQASGDSNYL